MYESIDVYWWGRKECASVWRIVASRRLWFLPIGKGCELYANSNTPPQWSGLHTVEEGSNCYEIMWISLMKYYSRPVQWNVHVDWYNIYKGWIKCFRYSNSTILVLPSWYFKPIVRTDSCKIYATCHFMGRKLGFNVPSTSAFVTVIIINNVQSNSSLVI